MSLAYGQEQSGESRHRQYGKRHIWYTEQSMPQLREGKYLLSHDRCLVCPLSDASPNRFQKLSSVSGLKREADDLFLALFICPCQIKHFLCFPPREGQKIIFFSQKIKSFDSSYFLLSMKGIQYNF